MMTIKCNESLFFLGMAGGSSVPEWSPCWISLDKCLELRGLFVGCKRRCLRSHYGAFGNRHYEPPGDVSPMAQAEIQSGFLGMKIWTQVVN